MCYWQIYFGSCASLVYDIVSSKVRNQMELRTYLGIKVIEIDTYDAFSTHNSAVKNTIIIRFDLFKIENCDESTNFCPDYLVHFCFRTTNSF